MGDRFFKHGELALVVLALLEGSPMHAYQLLGEIETIFGDDYEPSTGTIYPAVRALADEGLIASRPDGRRTVYSLTALGRRSLADRADRLTALELRTGVTVRPDPDLDHAFARARRLAEGVDPEKALVLVQHLGDELEALGRS